MALQQQPDDMLQLPNDVLKTILFRLPAKLVAQMRCISKPWNFLLCEPSFIKSYLHHSIHKSDGEILMVFPTSIFNRSFTAHPTRSPYLDVTDYIKLPVNTQLWSPETTSIVIGSLNGLICFYTYRRKNDYIIHTWNPSLSALIDIPSSYTIPSRKYDVVFRFGFDPKTDDYKVVKLTFRLLREKTPFGIFYVLKDWQQVEVYSFRKGAWTFINQMFPLHIKMIHYDNDLFLDGHDGHLHWLCDIGDDQKLQTIVAFDLCSESFHELFLPEPVVDYSVQCQNSLGILNDKLCVMSLVRASECEVGECHVWVMNKYGVTESWVKQHVFSLRCGILNPFGFTLNNEFLYEDNNKNLSLIDLVSNKVQSLSIKVRTHGKTKIVPYVESLVWVVPHMCGINISTPQFDKKDFLEEESSERAT